MNTPFNLQQEAEYVLGMTDLYQKDSEVAAMLKMKGLSSEQVSQVLAYVRQDSYTKRIRQAKKIMIIGLVIVLIAGPAWFYLISSDVYNPREEYIDRAGSRLVIRIPFYALLYGIVQTIYGIYRYITYSIKLKKHKTYI